MYLEFLCDMTALYTRSQHLKNNLKPGTDDWDCILMNAIHTSPQGNVKQFLRLTTTLSPAKTVLGIRKAVLDKAGVGDFAAELRRSGFEVTDRKNMRYFIKINHHVLQYWFCRFLHENSEVNYFTIGAKPVGLCSETTAILVSASEPSLASLVDLIRVSMMVTIYLENNWKNIEMNP